MLKTIITVVVALSPFPALTDCGGTDDPPAATTTTTTTATTVPVTTAPTTTTTIQPAEIYFRYADLGTVDLDVSPPTRLHITFGDESSEKLGVDWGTAEAKALAEAWCWDVGGDKWVYVTGRGATCFGVDF